MTDMAPNGSSQIDTVPTKDVTGIPICHLTMCTVFSSRTIRTER